jgi:hypothetical protein
MTTEYYIAHARGCDFRRLREKGFLTFYPDFDDYVFLEASQKNTKLLRKQTEFGIFFLREKKNGYAKTTESEIKKMTKKAGADALPPATPILVVEGYGANLDGVVLETDVTGRKVRCDLTGFNRHYNVWLDRMDLVEA